MPGHPSASHEETKKSKVPRVLCRVSNVSPGAAVEEFWFDFGIPAVAPFEILR